MASPTSYSLSTYLNHCNIVTSSIVIQGNFNVFFILNSALTNDPFIKYKEIIMYFFFYNFQRNKKNWSNLFLICLLKDKVFEITNILITIFNIINLNLRLFKIIILFIIKRNMR